MACLYLAPNIFSKPHRHHKSAVGSRWSSRSASHRTLASQQSWARPVRCSAGSDVDEAKTDAGTQKDASGISAEEASEPQSAGPAFPPATLRKLAALEDATQAMDLLAEDLAPGAVITESDCTMIMAAALERGNPALAQSIFQAMTATAAGVSASSLSSFDPGLATASGALSWPAATPDTAAALVIGLCRALRTREAMAVVQSVRSRGLPSSEDVHFGYVVECPVGAEGKPLAVVQPQEGAKNVADSFTRYEYELFSGRVVSTASDSLVTEANNLLQAAARRAGFLRRPAAGAVHTAVVETPSGLQRTFRFGTVTPDVPAKVGDRVTLVCSPQRAALAQRVLFTAAPPGTKPGEPLSLSNHTTRTVAQLLRPPAPGTGGLPTWLLPAAVTFVASDAASSLIDPVLPYLIAGAAATTAAVTVAGATVVLPKLKQLPERAVAVQVMRQKLLGQHVVLERRVAQLVQETEEDVRTLARLWQLQNKMGAASGGDATYAARLERVAAARAATEMRLGKRLEAVDAYARVLNMIEIEVEMETEVPAFEIEGIEVQIEQLKAVEDLQEEWKLQAEAQDEVERLLRASSL